MPHSPEKQAEWREGHRDWQRNYLLKRNYGISLAKYNQMVAEQCGSCAICGAVPSENPDEPGRNQKRLHVDHDHVTGKVRSLLCSDCNRGIGFLRENSEMLQRAALYLAEGR
jgi:Recombination endonuclease VII